MGDILDDAFNCPVCQLHIVLPRVYPECGHSVCEHCMVKNDMTDEGSAKMNTLPLYRCPVCRTATLQSWSHRPPNHHLISILETHNGYSERKAQSAMELEEWLDEHDHGGEGAQCNNWNKDKHDVPLLSTDELQDLAKVASGVRSVRAQVLYKQILPSVIKSACKGHSTLAITTNARELAQFAEEITFLLFRHGIYSVECTPREFVIKLVRCEESGWGVNRTNPRYVDPDVLEVHEDAQ